MKKKKTSLDSSLSLRMKADEILKNKPSETTSLPSEAELLKLIHELSVHQVELELQNEELQAAIVIAKDATEIYDFAPTGYFTLSKEGEILGLNLSGAKILGKERLHLKNSSFAFFVSDETRLIFNDFLKSVFKNSAKESCEIVLSTEGNAPAYVHLTGIATENAEHCIVTLTDLTEHKHTEEAIERQNGLLSKISQFSIDLSALPETDNLEAFISRRIKELTGASFVIYSEYDPKSRMMNPLLIDMEPGKLKKMVSLLGRQVKEVHPMVDEETYSRVKDRVIAKYTNLSDASFGAIPLTVSNSLSELLKTDRYIGIAYLIEGKLYGTSLLAMEKHMTDPSDEVLKNIAFLVALSLRRKRAEKALTQSEVRYRTLYENSLTGILITHPDGSILTANPEACRLLERSESEICHVGRKGIMDLSNPLLTSALAERAQTGQFRGELTFVRSDGSIFPTEIVSTIFSDPTGQLHSNIFFQDISKRKLAEEALQHEQWRLQSIIEGTNLGTWEWNVQTGKTIFNEQWAQLTGYSLKELQHLNISAWEKYTHPDDLKQSRELLLKHFSGELPYYDTECRMKHRDGQWVWVHDRGQVITRTADGKPLMMFGTRTDITERKQAEQALKESETRFKNLFQYHSAIMLLIEPESGLIVDANEAAVHFYGYSKAALQSMKIDDINSLSGEQIKMERQKARANKLNYFIFQHRLANGEERTVEVHSSPIEYQEKQILFSVIHDVTKRKQAEEALNSSQQLLEGIINTIPVRVFWKDRNLNYLGCNSIFLKDAGLTDVNEIIGKDDFMLSWRNQAELYRSDDKEVIDSGKAKLNIEEPQTSPTGNNLTLLTNKMPLRNSKGEINGLLGTYLDITERKQAEEKLRESEQRYRQLVETANEAILVAQGDRFKFVNSSTSELSGYSEEELLSIPFIEFIHPDDRALVADNYMKRLKGEMCDPSYSFRFITKGNNLRWVEMTGVKINWEGQPATLNFASDITARKQAVEALIESENKYRNIFSAERDALFIIDKETGAILDVNGAACSLYNYSRDEMLKLKNIDLSAEVEATEKATKEFQSKIDLRFHKKKDGTIFPVDISASLFTLNDKPVILAAIRDITDRTQNERILHEKNEELSKANAEKDKFFSIIAHDLRGPIGGFMGLSERMAEGMAEMTLDELQNIARVMKKSSSNLYSLLANLLEWSSMQRGLTAFEPAAVYLLAVIRESMATTFDAAAKKGIAISHTIPDELVVFADKNMLESILRNLAGNAVKFTPKGGNIRISANATSGNAVEISIADSGIGMNKNIVENLFNFDVNTSRKGTDGELSTGLGLMICRDFIEKNGGQLKVESAVGKGSTFRFTLPAVAI
ncbi:MAG: PAS domain S-box protein [Bacteroidales bacterium]|nr:PAS domain S-box protein [Bacteroidales bacterium]